MLQAARVEVIPRDVTGVVHTSDVRVRGIGHLERDNSAIALPQEALAYRGVGVDRRKESKSSCDLAYRVDRLRTGLVPGSLLFRVERRDGAVSLPKKAMKVGVSVSSSGKRPSDLACRVDRGSACSTICVKKSDNRAI